MWSTLWFDLRCALRSILRQPVFTLVVVATLAIGIGANTAMFALIHAALLKPLPYQDPDRLVLARRTLPGRALMWNSAPDYYDYREQVAGFETLAAAGAAVGKVTVVGGARPERVSTQVVSDDLLPMLGATPVAGRLFTSQEGTASAPYTVLVSAGLAERRFGSPQAAVGKALAVAGMARRDVSATVVGVLPSTFRFIDAADMWLPMRRGEDDGPETRRFHNWILVGRLKPGMTLTTVQTQIDVVARRLQQQYPDTNKVKGLRVDPLQSTLLRQQTPKLMMLMGAIGLVLLIACANVASMLLARGVGRRSELAVRAALGASRGRIAAQLLTESLLLAVMSGVAGILLAFWLRRLLPIAAGLADKGVVASGLEGQVLLFALAASVLTGLLCGVAPAWRASSLRVAEHLAPGARATECRGGSRLRSMLVTAQVALSLVLLVGAGLLVRSLAALTATDLRFDTRNLLATTIEVPYEDVNQRLQFQAGVHEDLAAIPGVAAVTFTSHMPFLEPWGDPPMYAAKRPPTDASQEQTALKRWVPPGFFKAMGIRMLSGRDLSPSDRIGTPLVMVVNDVFVREFFPGENPIGQRVIMPGGAPTEYEIVGVVDSTRTELVSGGPYPSVYVAANQAPYQRLKILMRSTLPPRQLTDAVRTIVAARNADIPVDPLERVEDIVGESLAPQRVTTMTLSTFSLLALLLAALGLYGVLAHYVTERTHEIGVRLALGAAAARVMTNVLRRSAVMVVPGLVVGVAASRAGPRLHAGVLYGVAGHDPVTFVSVSTALSLVAFAASAWPAWRAARVDPVKALRGE
ncbi:MAG: ABC transporter permease [Bacteroidales bacterium]